MKYMLCQARRVSETSLGFTCSVLYNIALAKTINYASYGQFHVPDGPSDVLHLKAGNH
jgi:hypothetical protein